MSPTEILIPLEVFTATHRVAGKVRIHSTGLWAVVHDHTTDYLEVIEAKLASLVHPRTLLAAYRSLSIAKVGIHAIAVKKPNHLGPTVPIRSTGGRRAYQVWGATQVFEVQGTFFWSGAFSSAAALADYRNAFLPLLDAQLRTIVFPTLKIQAPAMLVNRNKVDLFTPLSARIAPAKPTQSSNEG